MADERTDPQYKLRLPAELKARIETAAKAANRSMNAEIVSRLEESFETSEPDETSRSRAAAMAEQIVDRVIQRVEKLKTFERILLDPGAQPDYVLEDPETGKRVVLQVKKVKLD
jgi:hypothetical protein